MEKTAALKEYFGHSSFRPGQAELIDALLAGRDVLGVLPTGAGKSVCYQIPAMLLDGITLVVSPLISLMKDQVSALTQAGIPAAFINSSLSAAQYEEVFRRASVGRYKIIYVAPERLNTADFLRFAQNVPIVLVAVDEAHCVSQWGQDFRPGYLKIVDFIDALAQRPTLGAFTATATTDVKADIIRLLRLKNPLSLTSGFDRPNLHMEVLNPKSKDAALQELLLSRREKSGIIYCATRAKVERVCTALNRQGLSATRYHAGLDDQERRRNQEDFAYDRKRIMVATNAFGMGIDKSNVGFVIHYNMPKNLESYYQEAGRAGRDGEPADCILLYSPGDVQTAKYLVENSESEELLPEEREIVRSRDMERLDKMVAYCKTRACLRATILRYFGESASGDCGNCGNCTAEYEHVDITVPAQKILSCVARVEKKLGYGLGIALYVRMLHGSREQRILQLGLEQISTYGIMVDIDRRTIRAIIDYLVGEGYLEVSKGKFPVLHLTENARGVLFDGETVRMPVRKQELENRSHVQGVEESDGLFAALKHLRFSLAQEAGVPAYVVFTNATLTDMAAKRPQTRSQLLTVSGVGEYKARKFGDSFLAAIQQYCEANG